MNPTTKIIVVTGVLLGMLLASACGAPATQTATPTVDLNTLDLNPVRTQVAATVLAQITQDAALTPSATLAPSFTPTFLATDTRAAPATLPAGTTPSPQVQGSINISGTITATIALRNQAAWVSQTIADGTVFEPSETFTMTWTIKNVGESTWTTGYLLRFFAGDPFGAAREYSLSRAVAPQETIDITIPMTAPANPGNYRTDWVLSNESRANFNDPIFLKITVAAPPTLTPTLRPTVQPTPTR